MHFSSLVVVICGCAGHRRRADVGAGATAIGMVVDEAADRGYDRGGKGGDGAGRRCCCWCWLRTRVARRRVSSSRSSLSSLSSQ